MVVADFDPGRADTKVSGHFLKAVTKAVLLSKAETWVLTPRMERALSNFQHRVAPRLNGRQTRIREDGSWEYPSLQESVVVAVF